MTESQAGSYNIQTFSTTVDAELKRLKAQLELFWDKEIKLYQRFGLADGMAIIDCGCGPGDLSLKLLELFPKSRLTAIEIDPYLIDIFKQRLISADLQERCTVIQGSVSEMPLPDDEFNFAISRLVLEHLPDPYAAAREVKRVLKPGGKVAFVDNDFEFHLQTYPQIPELEQLYEGYCRARTAQGGRPRIGRELPIILSSNGFVNIELEVVCAHSELLGDQAFLRSEGVGISSQLVKNGYLSKEVLDKIALQWHELLQEDRHAFYRQLFIAAGEKPEIEHDRQVARDEKRKGSEKEQALIPEELLSSSGNARDLVIENFLAETVATALSSPTLDVAKDAILVDLGIDSLKAVEIQNQIKKSLGISISIVDFFEGQSLVDIARLLVARLEAKDRDHKGPVEKPASAGSGSSEWEDGEI